MTYEPDPQPGEQPVIHDEVVVERAAAAPTIRTVGATVTDPPRLVEARRVERVVEQPEPAVVHRQVATSSGRRLAVDSVVVGIVGVALMIIGLIAIARAGVDGSMEQPVVKVLGFTHTATLGFIEAGIGLCLLIAAAATSKSAAIFFGLVLGIGGVVGAAQADSFRRSLALQSGLAWLAVVAALVVVLVSLLIPRLATRTTRVEAI